RKLVVSGIDPGVVRKVDKKAESGSFRAVALEWYTKIADSWVPSHAKKILRRLEKDLFPDLGDKQVGDITAPQLLNALRKIENRGAVETAHRARVTA
ncbi:MAG: tyrosine-type recombinase/integrase, partial [Methyloligellaceae bacterium]